jgi:hypothetical protein
MAADHESFADLDAGAGTHGEESFGLRNGEAEGLLAENVLARLRSFDGPGDVKLIGERVVDGVDIGVGEELFVRSVSGGDAKGGCCFLSLRKIAGCDTNYARIATLLHGRDNFLEADSRGAENSPAELLGHGNNDKSETRLVG